MMDSFLCCLTFILYTVKCTTFASDAVSSSPLTWDFCRFAAWDFKDILPNSCIDNSDQPAVDDELSHRVPDQRVGNITKVDSTEDILTQLERYLLTNRTSGPFEDSRDDETLKDLHELLYSVCYFANLSS